VISVSFKGKGLPRIGRYRINQIKNYFINFICSDDKLKPVKPSSLYTPRVRKALGTPDRSGDSPFFLVHCLCEGLSFSASDYRFSEFAAEALLVSRVA
jgi:hypothetical protein